MKKWRCRIAILVTLVGVTLGVLYEMATHVGRGWLCGEAFYEGRPTSYWRLRCDEWQRRLDSPEGFVLDAVWLDVDLPNDGIVIDGSSSMYVADFDGDGFADIYVANSPPKTVWRRFLDLFRSQRERDNDWTQPHVLRGLPDAEPVLRELEQEEKYQPLVGRALKRIERQRVLEAQAPK